MKDYVQKHLSLRIDSDLWGKIRYIAQYHGHSINGLIIRIIRAYVRDFEREFGRIDL